MGCVPGHVISKFWQSNRYYLENGTRQRHSHSRRLIRCHLWPANGTTPMTVRNHEDYFSCFRPFGFPCCRRHNISYLQYVYTQTGRYTWPVISTVVSKMKDFSRSQAVSYTVKVVISRKRCKKSMLLETTNRKWFVACGIRWPWVSFKLIRPLCSNTTASFHTAVQQLKDFNWHSASRGPSAAAELLVKVRSVTGSQANMQ